MGSDFIIKAQQVWNTIVISNKIDPFTLNLQLEAHKKLLNVFQVGNYYYFLFNIVEMEFEYISEGVQKTLGYESSVVNANFILERIHPDDQPYFLSFEKAIIGFLSSLPIEKLPLYKVQYDFRLKNVNGEYVRILQQSILVDYEDPQRLRRSFVLHTDITHIKKKGIPSFSIIGLEDEPSYINVKHAVLSDSSLLSLSSREKEILKYMIEGRTSKQIADLLFVSLHTVNTHRKNMLNKTGIKSPIELVIKAISEGWV